MFLLPIDTVKPFINEYYLTWRPNSELLGFMPCSQIEKDQAGYYSVKTTKGARVAPVFFVPDMVFDSEPAGAVAGPALFFHGSDDGHVGIKFESRELSMQWIDECPYNDFEFWYQDYCRKLAISKIPYKLEWHN